MVFLPRLALAFIFLAMPVLARAELLAACELSDGRSLAGWEGNQAVWKSEDSVVTAETAAAGHSTPYEFLVWTGEVHNFELEFEYRIHSGAAVDFGIGFRARRQSNGGLEGYQADVATAVGLAGGIRGDGGRGLLAGHGLRVSIAPDGRRWEEELTRTEAAHPTPGPQSWNTCRLTAKGSHVELWIDGVLRSALDDHSGRAMVSGRLGLFLRGGSAPAKVECRNLRLWDFGTTAKSPVGVPPHTVVSVDLVKPGESDRQQQSAVLWQLRPNPAKPSAVANPDAQRVVAGIQVEPGFQVELIAAEPDVFQPIAFAIDPRGRLWVAEGNSYPTKQPAGQGKDRIVIFEDADADGRFETRKVFVEGLNLVSGLELGFGGVWVGAAPQLLFIPDRDGDDHPDGPPVVLLDGWGYQDSHETLNSLTWGPDGWLYGCQGIFVRSNIGVPGTPESQRVAMREGVWRYHPVSNKFEVYAHGGSNQWGLDFNSDGHLFMTHPRSFYGGGGTSYVIRNGYYWNQTNSNYPGFISNTAPEFAPALRNYLPASSRFDSGEGGAGRPGSGAIYGGHSHVGAMIYLGDNWPQIYRDHLFTINLHGRQLNHQHNVRSGSGYETLPAGYDLFHVPEPSFMGIDIQYGPDGAAYIIDWCDNQHCHSMREEEWSRSDGRIYRLSWAETFQPVKVDLNRLGDLELARLHRQHNEWFVRTARRLLQERASVRELDPAAVELVREMLASQSDGLAVLRGLWTLNVTGHLAAAELRAAARHPDERVRAWAATLASEFPLNPIEAFSLLRERAEQDSSPAVRLAVASALQDLPVANRWQLAEMLAAHGEDAADRFLPRMIWFGLAGVVDADIDRAHRLASTTPLPSLADSIRWYIARTVRGRDLLVEELLTGSEAEAERLLRLLAFSLKDETKLVMPAAWPRARIRLGAGGNLELKATVDQVSLQFGDQTVLARTRDVLGDGSAPLADRRRAFDLLKRMGDDGALPVYVRLLDDPQFGSAVIPLLAASSSAETAAALLRRFPQLEPADKVVALTTLSSRAELAIPLLEAVRAGRVEKKYLTSMHVRQIQSLRVAKLDELVDQVWGKVTFSSADLRARMAGLKKAYVEAPKWAYDARAGQKLFTQLCATCHTISGVGGKFGPDLTDSWRNGVDYFLESIIDPNASVGLSYQLHIVELRDGTVHSGLVESETSEFLTLRTLAGTVRIALAQIKEQNTIAQSMMPPGLLDELSEKERVEFLKYLTTEK